MSRLDEVDIEWTWLRCRPIGEVTMFTAPPRGRTAKWSDPLGLLAWPPAADDDAAGYNSPDDDDGAPLPDDAESDPDGALDEWADSSMDYARERR
jgi:hypothetical protein